MTSVIDRTIGHHEKTIWIAMKNISSCCLVLIPRPGILLCWQRVWQQWSVAISMARSPDGQTFICWWLWWVWWGNWQALPTASDNSSSKLPCCDVLCWKWRMQSYQSHQSSLSAWPVRLGRGFRTNLYQPKMDTWYWADSGTGWTWLTHQKTAI